MASIEQAVEFSINGPMVSASGDAEDRKYRLLFETGGRRWLVADQPEAADNIYADGGPGSQGMAGRTLRFALIDGTTVDFTGPWKTGADALFKATGFDVRNRYLTRGIIALNRQTQGWNKADIFTNVLHYDDAPALGSFDRIKEMAKDFAAKLKCKVWYSVTSKAGGCASWVDAP